MSNHELESKIRELAREISGEEPTWIRFLPQTNSIGKYFKANDIFLSPSRSEAFGYANVEAVYCGNSIVLSRVGGQAQLQIDGAYWFESENVDDFVEKLELAIQELSTPEKQAQRESVKAQVQRIYSIETWAKKVVELLQN